MDPYKVQLEQLLDDFEKGQLMAKSSRYTVCEQDKLFLYGAGNVGKRLWKNMQESGVSVLGFIDIRGEQAKFHNDIQVIKPDDKVLEPYYEDCQVIISALFSVNELGKIKEKLRSIGFQNVYGLHEVNLSKINSVAFYENLFDGSYNKLDLTGKDRARVTEALDLLQDDPDKALFIEHLKAHLTMDFVNLSEPFDAQLQYLAHDIPAVKDYTRFIDCGGYNGDTIRQIENAGHAIKNVAVFEPQTDLFRQLSVAMRASETHYETCSLFPCGVSSKTEKLKFSVSADAVSAGRIDDNGEDIVQCVAIDDAVMHFNPTFIKMDIEGAEIAALCGAERTIRESRPQLAICVYHRLSDLWEVPLLINSFVKDYVYYLRTYNYMGLETVLYAFPK